MRETSDRESNAFALLEAGNPVDVEGVRRELNEERLAAARARVFEEPENANGVRRHLGWRAVAGATAAAITAAGLFLLFQGGAEPANPLRVLNAAASIAAREPASVPGPGEYLYVRQRSGVVGGPSVTVEWWIASDGSGRMVRRGPQATAVWSLGNGHKRVLPATVTGRARTTRNVRFGPGGFEDLYARVNPGLLGGRTEDLPTDAASLERVLRSRLERAADFNPDPGAYRLQMLQVIQAVLANPLASPQLRSAAYEVAARLDGVSVDQDATDPVGRRAAAVALCSAGIPAHYELFFDPATSATLGAREVSPAPCGVTPPASAIASFTAYLEKTTVDSIHERP
jgi:hypothetical protein